MTTPPPPPPQNYPEVRIEIKPSIILPGEIGVFATRRIAKDAVIVPAAHFTDIRLLEWAVFETLDALTKRKLMGYCPGTAEGLLAPADLNYISVAWQMNHSCQPNVGFNAAEDFVAMHAIKRGEELCWDYAFGESNPKFRMRCRCGAAGCRGVVTGNDWQVLVNDPNKAKYFSAELRRHIAAVPDSVCRGFRFMSRRDGIPLRDAGRQAPTSVVHLP
ncbi:MAG: SET domain-containing protein-lysine N-methyltransferase [Sulfuritalea sp.]|nr:SET domain-containing protein-lysine N-methyltransferase [Sulfuritalea sp.]